MSIVEIDTYCNLNKPAWPDKFGRMIARDCCRFDSDSDSEPIKVLSLFSGAGGLDIGFHDAGFKIVESVELEKKFCNTLELNSQPGKIFEGTSVVCRDIREYTPDVGVVDFIIGGPPCQTFSAAGRRANGVLGTTDSRGILFKEYVRILQQLKPKGFLFENVYGIVGAQGGKAWREILEAFSSVGYKLFYRILDAADYGAPQHRERLIIVGLSEGVFDFPRPLFGPDSLHDLGFYSAACAIKNALNKDEDVPPAIAGRYASLIPEIPPGLNYSYFTKEMGHPQPLFAWRSKFSDFMYKADPSEPVRTIKAQGGQYTGPFHWEGRHFSVPEYKRLQSIPDDYEISGSRGVAIHQIGNSVPPQLARILALSIRKQVFNRSIPIKLTWLSNDEELGFRKRKHELTKLYRARAKEYITKLSAVNVSNGVAKNGLFSASFNPSTFAFKKDDGDESLWNVAWKTDDNLRIDVISEGPVDINIHITPKKGWTLPFQSIDLFGVGNDEMVFTVMWRALDYYLSMVGLKADLVQLSNYYQYPAAFNYSVKGSYDEDLLLIFNKLGPGDSTRVLLDSKSLSDNLGIPEKKIRDWAKRMRRLGFEVRNNNTNSQIPKGFWLIPYEFPTLTPLSVQLNKEV